MITRSKGWRPILHAVWSLTLFSSSVGAQSVSTSPASLSFAAQIGTTSPVQSVTLANTGTVALSITGIGLTGTNKGDFKQTNTCGSSIPAGGNRTISVAFMPTVSGNRTATLTVTDNASGSPQPVSLTGTGTAPAISLSPTSVSFGNQGVGTTSAAQIVTLTSTGAVSVSVTKIAITGANSGDFAETTTCGSSVAVGAS